MSVLLDDGAFPCPLQLVFSVVFVDVVVVTHDLKIPRTFSYGLPT